jgi:hypothetical protein
MISKRMRARLGSRLQYAFLAGVGVLVMSSLDVSRAEAQESVAKKECLTQHEQSQVFKQASKLKAAREALLTCSRDVCPSFIRADCVEWLGQLDRSIPSVVPTAKVNKKDETNVRVTVDGQLAATRLDGKPIELDPGVHTFRFELAPWPPVEQQVLVAEGEKNRTVSVQFGNQSEDGKESDVPMYRPFPTIDYVLGGTAVVGIGLFAAFGSMGMSGKKDLQNTCAPFCSTTDVNSKVKSKFLIADIGLGVAVASTVLGVILYATRPSYPIAPGAEEPKKPGASKPKASFGIEPMRSGAFLSVQTEL